MYFLLTMKEVSLIHTKLQCNFNIDILDKEVDMDAINAEVIGPSGPVYLNFDLGPNGGRAFFQPDEIGMHELLVTNEGEAVRGAPHYLRSMPKSKKDYDGKLTHFAKNVKIDGGAMTRLDASSCSFYLTTIYGRHDINMDQMQKDRPSNLAGKSTNSQLGLFSG